MRRAATCAASNDDAGERDLAAVGREVVLAGRIHPVEPRVDVGGQVARRAAARSKHEQVRHLAGGEPGVPEAVDALLGDVRLDRILGAALELGGGRLGREMALHEHALPNTSPEPSGSHRGSNTPSGSSVSLRASPPASGMSISCALAVGVLARERELRAVGRDARLGRRDVGRGERDAARRRLDRRRATAACARSFFSRFVVVTGHAPASGRRARARGAPTRGSVHRSSAVIGRGRRACGVQRGERRGESRTWRRISGGDGSDGEAAPQRSTPAQRRARRLRDDRSGAIATRPHVGAPRAPADDRPVWPRGRSALFCGVRNDRQPPHARPRTAAARPIPQRLPGRPISPRWSMTIDPTAGPPGPPTTIAARASVSILNMLLGLQAPAARRDPARRRSGWTRSRTSSRLHGRERADFLLRRVLKRARQLHVGLPGLVQSRYINTISPEQEPPFPGDEAMEKRIRRIIRWNAAAMVVRANNQFAGLGGHLSTYASAASLYEVGFNHFFRGKDDGGSGDQVFFQGHAAPGIYSRAFLEGRLSEAQLEHFRREVARRRPVELPASAADARLLGVPHRQHGPRARSTRSTRRASTATSRRAAWRTRRTRASGRSWATARRTSPRRPARSTLASREGLDNLTFVINCNLQRLDGPVRGNGKIIQELEAVFTGAGWNVIKVICAREWDALLAKDVRGRARGPPERNRGRRLAEVPDRDRAPTCASTSSAPIRGC